MINFEETELRLGLPGGCDTLRKESEESELKSNGKRGFSETETVDLKLNLSTSSTTTTATSMKDAGAEQCEKMKEKNGDVPKPPAKAQVVGWPPVRSFRKNVIMSVQKANAKEEVAEKAFVKVSMDGAPYLRKVDLKMYRSYEQLSEALAKMFGNCGSQGSETKLVDLVNGSEYVPTYEDKDGDWMLVGDVPWEMFVQSCKRLRIMKASEAIGLAPRAVEARNNRS